jgi:hypothetical protein
MPDTKNPLSEFVGYGTGSNHCLPLRNYSHDAQRSALRLGLASE